MTVLERAWRGSRNDWQLHILSVFSVAVAFVCLLATALVAVNVQDVRQRWAGLGRLSVYLAPATTRQSVADIEAALRKTGGVRSVHFVSSESAREELMAASSDPILQKLPNEAFPASLEIELVEGIGSQRAVAMASQLESLRHVEAVETYGEWSARLGKLLSGGVTAAAILALIVFAAVGSVVSSTIRMALQRRRREVEILKLVGATDNYVRQPFVLEGAAQGAIGSILAVGIVGCLYLVIRSSYDGELGTLLGLTPRFLSFWMILAMVGSGAALGALSAYASLRRLLAI